METCKKEQMSDLNIDFEKMFELVKKLKLININKDIPKEYKVVYRQKYFMSKNIKRIYLSCENKKTGVDLAFEYKRNGSCEMISVFSKDFLNKIMPDCLFKKAAVFYDTQQAKFEMYNNVMYHINFTEKDGEYQLENYRQI